MKLFLESGGPAADLSEPDKPWAVVSVGRCQAANGMALDITLAKLEAMAAAYDPAIERAAINFDHVKDGPSHGSLRDPFVRGNTLFAYHEDLSAEAREQIKTRKRFRQSAEINLRHPVTGDWYLDGFALLGAKRSAVKNLPEITLSESPEGGIVMLQEPTEEKPMAEKTAEQIAAELEIKAKPGEAKPEAPAAALAAANAEHAAALAEFNANSAELRARTAELAALSATTRRALAVSRVDTDLAPLIAEARVVPAMLRDGLRDALIELAAAETPQTVTLAAPADGGAAPVKPLYAILLAALKGVPRFGPAASAALASVEVGAALAGDKRTDEQRAVDLAAGIKDEEAMRLQAAHPGMFGPVPTGPAN